jgi:hypothetical protein
MCGRMYRNMFVAAALMTALAASVVTAGQSTSIEARDDFKSLSISTTEITIRNTTNAWIGIRAANSNSERSPMWIIAPREKATISADAGDRITMEMWGTGGKDQPKRRIGKQMIEIKTDATTGASSDLKWTGERRGLERD